MINNIKNVSKNIAIENEKIVLSINISPINRTYFIFCFTETDDKLHLIFGGIKITEYMDFIKEYIHGHARLDVFFDEIEPSRDFIQACRKRFLKKEEITDEEIISLVKRICDGGYIEKLPEWQGLDGFSLTADISGEKDEIHFWQIYYNVAYTDLATLGNSLLERVGIKNTQNNKFVRYAKKPPVL